VCEEEGSFLGMIIRFEQNNNREELLKSDKVKLLLEAHILVSPQTYISHQQQKENSLNSAKAVR
jgi:hypothetical protein